MHRLLRRALAILACALPFLTLSACGDGADIESTGANAGTETTADPMPIDPTVNGTTGTGTTGTGTTGTVADTTGMGAGGTSTGDAGAGGTQGM